MNDTMDIPEFTRLDLTVVWRLGRDLAEQCLQEGHGVTICAKLGQQHAFHAALPGTSADNDAWVHRKLRVVEHFGIASLAVQERYVTDSRDFYRDFGLEPSRYAPAGGAVPLLVAGVLVGGLGISGLDSVEDHMLALSAIRRWCS